MNLKLLDCTIRDGGYINNWEFSMDFAQALYRATSESGCAYTEIGFFNPKEDGQLWKHCSPEVVRALKDTFPCGTGIAVMIDYGSCKADDLPSPAEYPVDLVRVAAAKGDKGAATEFAAELGRKGYRTTINYMAVTEYSNGEILELLALINRHKSDIAYFYIADSFGALMPRRAHELFTAMRFGTDAPLGFHPHNNLQLAFANSLNAIEAGFDIIDGSILGMGRGAGNLYLEAALAYLEKLEPERFNLPPILRFAEMLVEPMQSDYDWGYSLTQLISGSLGCHPNYPTNLLRLKNYTADDVYEMLHSLPTGDRGRFAKPALDLLIGQHEAHKTRAASAKPLLDKIATKLEAASGEVLLLCGGRTVKTHQAEIKSYIEARRPLVIAVNHPSEELPADGVFFGNARRLWQYHESIGVMDILCVQGLSLPDPNRPAIFVDYKAAFSLPASMNLTNSGVIGALCMAAVGAKRVCIAGMDGFDPRSNDDFYYAEADRLFDASAKAELNVRTQGEIAFVIELVRKTGTEISSLTPSLYSF